MHLCSILFISLCCFVEDKLPLIVNGSWKKLSKFTETPYNYLMTRVYRVVKKLHQNTILLHNKWI